MGAAQCSAVPFTTDIRSTNWPSHPHPEGDDLPPTGEQVRVEEKPVGLQAFDEGPQLLAVQHLPAPRLVACRAGQGRAGQNRTEGS